MGLACRSHKMHQHPPSMLLNVSETSRIIGEILDSCTNRPTKVKLGMEKNLIVDCEITDPVI